MTSFELLHVSLRRGDDAGGVRQVAGRVATALGLARPDVTRFATAVSEVGRVGARQARTTTTFVVVTDESGTRTLTARFGFTGEDWREQFAPGAPTATAVGRLLDRVDVVADGVVLRRELPRTPAPEELVQLRHELLTDGAGDLQAALQSQNTELVGALVALRDREAELVRLNLELEQTNRGVVALYAELERRAGEIRTAQRGVFEELERALRPQPPLVPGLELDVRYLPAQANSPTGGDLYDWLVVPDGTIHVTVVDVQGHGVTSTRDALLITHTVRTLVQEGHALGRVLQRADTLLQLPGRPVYATALLARVDPRSGTLELAGAGHPPALLQTADGAVRYLEAPGRSFGYPGAGSAEVTRVQLADGDTVLLYTDGLIEIRHDILEGLATLEAAATNAVGLGLPQRLDTVLAGCTRGDPLRDDTLLLGLRWWTSQDDDGDQQVRLPSSVAAPGLARRYVRSRTTGLAASMVDDATLLTSELVGNAFRHGGPPIRLTVRVGERSVRVSVRDDGDQIPYRSGELPEASTPHGRGLFLVATLARRWGVDYDDADGPEGPLGKTVWFEL